MPASFKKALLVAGLAAALVGCGGGSSNTTMTSADPVQTPAQKAAEKIQASYDTAKGLVDGLTVDSSDERVRSVRNQVNLLLSDIRTTTGLEDRSGFIASANMLLEEIDTNTTPPKPTAAEKIQSAKDALANAQAEISAGMDDDAMLAAYKKVSEAAKALQDTLKANDGSATDLDNASNAYNMAKDKISELEMNIKIAADQKKQNDAWYKAVKGYDVKDLKSWPPTIDLAGTSTTVNGLPDDWTGKSYDYPRVGSDRNEQGRTFSKTITKVIPEIEFTWENLAREAAKSNRNSLINDYLGGANIQIQAIESGAVLATGKNSVPAITATNTPNGLGGSGRVFTDIDLGVRTFPATNPPVVNATGTINFAAVNTVRTQFRKEDFKPMDANSLAGATFATPAARRNWYNHDESIPVTIATESVPIMWKNVPGLLSVNSEASGASVVGLRFNDGILEVAIDATSAAGNDLTISFVPVSFENNPLATADISLATQNIHTIPLTLREAGTKSAVTEFAYWASQRTADPFTVDSFDTFARQHPDKMFDLVTTASDKLTGEATYTGLAAGYYAKETQNGDFTADAMLTANFNTDKVYGSINDFTSITGGGNLSSWKKLTLSPVDIVHDDTKTDKVNEFGNQFRGNTIGGGAVGYWNGQFLGMANPGLEDDLESAANITNDYPEAVIGNFTGHFSDGHVAGAFGVDLDESSKERE